MTEYEIGICVDVEVISKVRDCWEVEQKHWMLDEEHQLDETNGYITWGSSVVINKGQLTIEDDIMYGDEEGYWTVGMAWKVNTVFLSGYDYYIADLPVG